MPKLKTNRGAKKRVRMTASGKLKRRHAFKSHIAATKNAKRRRQLKSPNLIATSDMREYRQLLA